LKVLSKNIETGVYTAEFSTDVVEKKMAELQAQVDKLTAAQTVTA
jgi:tetrahydromethanopterin S-methyltransferase subunit B